MMLGVFRVCVIVCYFSTVSSGERLLIANDGVRRVKRNINNEDLKPDVQNMLIESNVSVRFGTIYFEATLQNPHGEGVEGQFIVQIPTSAFISNFSMVIDDKEIISKVYPKEVAQKKYEEAVQNGSTAGQVSSRPKSGRGMDVFSMNVNIASKATVIFKLTYNELLERRQGFYTQRISITPQQPVGDISFVGHYEEPQGFRNFSYKLPGSDVWYTASTTSAQLEANPGSRIVSYSPTALAPAGKDATESVTELRVSYDVQHENNGGLLITQGNHFVHYFSPTGLPPLEKSILFIIDISGSMEGRKEQQTREAMVTILGQVRSTDAISILLFDSVVTQWKQEPVYGTPANVEDAKRYVLQNVKARGSTNINIALLASLDVMRRSSISQDNGAQIIVFITDGNPTDGEQNTLRIRKNFLNKNEPVGASLFCLGLGFNLEFQLLDDLAYENGGFAKRIYEADDTASQLENFYYEISSPLLLDVEISYTTDVSYSTTQNNYAQYFDGSEIIVAGELDNAVVDMEANIVAKGKSTDRLRYSVNPSDTSSVPEKFAERIWAYKKIKDLIKEMNVAEGIDAQKFNDTRSRALEMSLAYGFVTPLTSLLVVDNDLDLDPRRENTMLDVSGNIVHSMAGSATMVNHHVISLVSVLTWSLICIFL